MKRIVLLAALLPMAALVHANPTVERDGRLASKEGRTLYTFDKDAPGQSRCSGSCLAAWPAFAVANPALAGGDFSIVVRDDGSRQWAWRGKPLYFFAGDAKPGEANGDKQGGVWHIVPTTKKSAVSEPAPVAGYSYTY